MAILVTGSAGHLGEALIRMLRASGRNVIGLDINESPCTDFVGSITDRRFISRCMVGVGAVLHTATLHKPHVATHSMQDFVETNVIGTLVLLEAATAAGVEAFVFTSTTSVFGNALRPPAEARSVWVTEGCRPIPRNIYGVTKAAAEELCELFHAKHNLPAVVLRTSRFFPEPDDDPAIRLAYDDANIKANEYLYRRADIADVADAHVAAMEKAQSIGFDRFIISATTPFHPDDTQRLRHDAPSVVAKRVPEYLAIYRQLGWKMFPGIDRVYVNRKAREILNWNPRYDFDYVLEMLAAGRDPRSALARTVGAKGYHAESFSDGPYPVE